MAISPSVSLMEVECVGEESHHASLHMVSPTEQHLCTCTTHEQRDTHVIKAAEAQKVPAMSWATLQSLRTGILTSGHSICLSLSFSLAPSLSLSLIICFLLSHGGVGLSVLFAHIEIIIFGILRTENHERGWYWAYESAVFDLPSFDVVQEGHFNVHQKGKKCYLKVISVFK